MKFKIQCKYVVTKDYEGNIVSEEEKKYYIMQSSSNGMFWNKYRFGKNTAIPFKTKEDAMKVLKTLTYNEIHEENYTND